MGKKTAEERLIGAAKPGRYPGIYRDRHGAALAATTGHWLVVVGHLTLEGAIVALKAARADSGLPSIESISRVLRYETNFTAERAAERTVTKATVADESMRSAGLADLAKRTAHARAGGIVGARASLREAEGTLRRLEAPQDLHGILVGDAAFDLRIVRGALRALGVKTGKLYARGRLDPAVLETSTGVGIVMPFRRVAP